MIPQRLIELLRRTEGDDGGLFPPTEIFNEGWMLRLVIDAMSELRIANHPLQFRDGARWYSEAWLMSPFRPQSRPDPLGETFTHADAVIGHFNFSPTARAGLTLAAKARQFVVVEAKMFSNLSLGTKNASGYDQAARNVACVAEVIKNSGIPLGDFETVGFCVVAPAQQLTAATNLQSCMTPGSIRRAVDRRISLYEAATGQPDLARRNWERDYFHPLIDRLVQDGMLTVRSWEDCIAAIGAVDPTRGSDLDVFYRRCLKFAPRRSSEA